MSGKIYSSDAVMIIFGLDKAKIGLMLKFGSEYRYGFPDGAFVNLWLFLKKSHRGRSSEMVAAHLQEHDRFGNVKSELHIIGSKVESVLFSQLKSEGVLDHYFGHHLSQLIFHSAKCDRADFGNLHGFLDEVSAFVGWDGDCTSEECVDYSDQFKVFSNSVGPGYLFQIDWRTGLWRGETAKELLRDYDAEPGDCISVKTAIATWED